MSANPIGNIRLAPGGDRTSIIYNTYHLLTQMAAFYGNASQQLRPPPERAVYAKLSDDLIKDLGDLYMAWESIDKGAAAPVSRADKLAHRVSHTCAQFSKIIMHANEWTPFARLLSLSILVEKRWNKILRALSEGAGKEAAVLAELIKRSGARGHLVTAELQQCRLAGRLTQDAFDAADQKLLDKSFGF